MSDSHDVYGPRFLMAASQGPRDEQQDAGVCLRANADRTALLVVSDGVGGQSGGRLASQVVAELALQLWTERKGHLSAPLTDLEWFCREAHGRINQAGARRGVSPRATVVALYLTPTCAYWVHSGDSRLYHFRARQIVSRTADHSLLQVMVEQGMVTEEERGSHPDQGALLQCLGGEEYQPPTQGSAHLTPHDGFLLCTDGFWERTKEEEMAEILYGSRVQAGALLDQAVERAVQRNGPAGDNVTVALAMPMRAETASAPRPTRQAFLLLLAGLLALAAAAIWCLTPKNDRPAPGTSTRHDEGSPNPSRTSAPGLATPPAPSPTRSATE